MSEDRLVLLQSFLDPNEAEIARGLLEANDIHCFVENAHANNTMWHLQVALGGTRLMVLASDLEQAREVFKNNSINTDDNDKPWLDDSKEGLFRTFISFIITMFSGAPTALKKRTKDDISR